MKKLSLVALLVILSACKSERGEAIHAKVLLPSVSATCVRFEVRDLEDRVLETRWLPRTDDELRIAIFRGTLPETVKIAARPYKDGDCQGGQEARTPNGPFEAVTASFIKDEVTTAGLQLRPGTDEDGDGYVSTDAGGADCQDAPGQGGVNPGVQEQCSDQTDLNCDGRKGCEAASCAANACVGPPAHLLLTLPAGSVQAGTCTSATVQVKDANGSDTRVGAAAVVSLQAVPAAGITFYADAGCTAPAASVTLAAGEGGATFYFQGQIAGDVTINATATGLTQDSKIAQVVPGPGNRLVFTSPARIATAGVCSAVVQFQSQDAQGNAAPVTAATAITLMASPATSFRFFSDSSCTDEVASVTLATSASSGSFYFMGTRSGTVAVTLTAAGLTGSSQDATINPGSPAAMVFTGPTTLQAGDCSIPVTVELRDTFGNPANAASNTTITLTNPSGVALTYSTDSGCSPTTASVSIAQGASTASFHYRGTAVGTSRISGTASGLLPTPLDVTIIPGPATTLAFTTAAQTLAAGSCSAVVRVQLRDAFNNPVSVSAETAVALSADPPTGFQFFTDSNCTVPAGASVNIAANSSEASFHFRGTSAGTPAMSAAVSGVPAATQNVTINPGPPTVLLFSQPSLMMVAGMCTQVTLLVQDTFGNASPVSSNQQVTFAAAPSTGFTFSPNADCSGPVTQLNVQSGQSSRVLYVRGTAAGSVTVTASRTNYTSGTLAVTVNPAAPSKLAFQTVAQTVEVNACSGITTVQLQDTFNNVTPAAANTQIDLSGSTGTITFYSDAACNTPAAFVTVPAGQNSASFYFKDSTVESVTITAASTGLTSADQAQTITPLAPTELAFVSAAQTVAMGACSGLATVETRAGGIPTTVTTATTVDLGAAPAGISFYTNSNCSTLAASVIIGAGQGTANFYFKGTVLGTFTITASSTGLTSATQSATITPTPTKLLFTTPAHTTVAGVCSAIVTVQTADATNTGVPAATNTTVNLSQTGTVSDTEFRFYSDASCGTTTTSVSIPAGQSTASFYYKGEKVRTVTLTAQATGLTSATQDHSMVAGDATVLAFPAATPAQTLLAGMCSGIRTVEARDAFGNLATNGVTLNLTGSTTAEFFQDLNCTTPVTNPVTIPAGNSSTSFYFKGFTGGINANGTLTLTAASTTAGITSATQAETIIPTVRTGSCSLSGTSVNCTLAPALLDMNKAFLVFQATSANATSDQANVRCYLNSVSQVRCERAVNTGSNVNIRWSVAELPSGVNVQHQTVACGGDTTNVALSNVTMDRTFLLLSSQRNVSNMDSSVPRLVELMTETLAEIRKTGGCGGGGTNDTNHVQAVNYAGATVLRGEDTLANGFASAQFNVSPSVDLARSILLYSYISDGSGTKICDRVLRGELTDGGSKVTFSRGEGDTTNCVGSQFNSISWEVVQFPVGTVVHQVTQQLSGALESATIPAVDRSRTIVIGGGQWASGQLHGEGQHSSSELISEMRAQAYLVDSTTLHFYRESSNNTARFTAYVVQLKP